MMVVQQVYRLNMYFIIQYYYTFLHFKRRFLYSENYIKINCYIILMNNEELIKEINILKGELEKTKNELVETKEHLKKYTAPSNMKKYYQNHKEEIIKRVKEYKEKNNYKPNINKEKRKEYNKLAYQKRKEKIEKEKMEKENI
jgi:hypothetical protein